MRAPARMALAALVLCLGDLPAGLSSTPAAAEQSLGRADFRAEPASKDGVNVADWVVASGDNHGLPFVIVDKVAAKVFVFDQHGRLRGAAPALLGLARGDDPVPGIGERALSSIRPEERTTTAGRFVAALGHDLNQNVVVWVDYGGAIALHRVVTSHPEEHRLQRLASASPQDHRISYGCINVPAEFFDTVVRPAFTGTNGIVYVLPEVRSLGQVFSGYAPPEHGRPSSAAAGAPSR